jgi:uncharacterized OB-fold protein
MKRICEVMPFCANCGKEVSEAVSFCPDCGERLKKQSNSLVAAGYVCAVLALFIFPIGLGIAGLVIGIINITKGRVGHGVAQIVIAVTFGILGAIWGAIVWG